MFVGAGLAIVGLLYAATLLSDRRTDPGAEAEVPAAQGAPAAAIPSGPPPPLPEPTQAAADAFEALSTADGWFESGRIYLTAGFEAQQRGDAAGVLWVRKAISDFEQSLELEDRADTRFALAEAAQFDPSDPMRPVTELQALLSAYPEHVGGNFLLGERRMTIGRVDSARASFERVIALTSPADPLNARAQEMIGLLGAAAAR